MLLALPRTLWHLSYQGQQIGTVYRRYSTITSGGNALGLALAAPLFAVRCIPLVIGLCAVATMSVGRVSLARFGFREPAMAASGEEVEGDTHAAHPDDALPVPAGLDGE